MDTQATTIGHILENIGDLSFDLAVYGPKNTHIDVSTPVILANPDDLLDSEEEPETARHLGFEYLILLVDVRDIILNAKEQLGEPSQSQLLEALNFYQSNDAYIQF